jgi:hypothetical protein
MPRSTIQISSLINAQIAESDFLSAEILLGIYALGIGSKHLKVISAHLTDAYMLSREPTEGLIGSITPRDTSKGDITRFRSHRYCRLTDNDEMKGRKEY